MDSLPHNRVTYSPVWTLIPTHYCRNTCGSCTLVKRTGQHAQLPAAYRAALAPQGFTHAARLAVHQSWATPFRLAAETLKAAERARRRLPETFASASVDLERAGARRRRCASETCRRAKADEP